MISRPLTLAIMYETGEGSNAAPEKKQALVHRVIVPDKDYPKEYAILVTDLRSIFIRLKKTRSSFVLRQEMRIGTALVTDAIPKTLEDYEQTSLQTLESDSQNLTVPHEAVASLAMKADPIVHRKRDFFVRTVMKMQKEIFQVYNFDMNYKDNLEHEKTVKFYAVPLGAYFKPRRQTQTRERILRDYAMDTWRLFGESFQPKLSHSEAIGTSRNLIGTHIHPSVCIPDRWSSCWSRIIQGPSYDFTLFRTILIPVQEHEDAWETC